MSMRELEVMGAFKGVRCQLDERGGVWGAEIPYLPRAVFKSLHRQTLIYLCTQVCTLLTYCLYAISNVLCPLSCVVCMCALYLCMHVSVLKNHSSLLSA